MKGGDARFDALEGERAGGVAALREAGVEGGRRGGQADVVDGDLPAPQPADNLREVVGPPDGHGDDEGAAGAGEDAGDVTGPGMTAVWSFLPVRYSKTAWYMGIRVMSIFPPLTMITSPGYARFLLSLSTMG